MDLIAILPDVIIKTEVFSKNFKQKGKFNDETACRYRRRVLRMLARSKKLMLAFAACLMISGTAMFAMAQETETETEAVTSVEYELMYTRQKITDWEKNPRGIEFEIDFENRTETSSLLGYFEDFEYHLEEFKTKYPMTLVLYSDYTFLTTNDPANPEDKFEKKGSWEDLGEGKIKFEFEGVSQEATTEEDKIMFVGDNDGSVSTMIYKKTEVSPTGE